MNNKTYNIISVREYIEGWLGSDTDQDKLTLNQVVAMLRNTLACIEDESDGIEAYISRKQYYGKGR